MHRGRLARARDVIEFTLDREKGGAGDRLGVYALDLAVYTLDVPGTTNQAEVLEHDTDRVEVVVGVHVQHRGVLIVTIAVRFTAGFVAFDQVLEVVVVAFGVVAGVHRHKAGVLQETWIDAPPSTRKVGRHPVNHIVFKPAMTLVHGQVVDCRGRLAGVNRATHHDHAQGRYLTPAGHEPDGGQHRHSGLAHAHDVTVAVNTLQVVDELLHIVHVVIQMELALGHRNQTCILPVGDIDLVVFQHGLDGIAQ